MATFLNPATIGRDVTYVTLPKGSVSRLSRFTPRLWRDIAGQLSRMSRLSRIRREACS